MWPVRRRNTILADPSGEAGTTLVEVSVVIALLGVVLAALLTFLLSTQSTLDKQVSRSSSNDQVRLAVGSLDREVRSGNVLYGPSTENYSAGDVAPGMAVRVYTRTNFPTRGAAVCVQWRITSGGELQRRSWATDWLTEGPGLSGGWQIIATGITNRTEGIPAFTQPTTDNIISLRLRANADANKGSTVEIRHSVSGRNTIFFSSKALCGPTTPDPALTAADGSRVPPY